MISSWFVGILALLRDGLGCVRDHGDFLVGYFSKGKVDCAVAVVFYEAF